MKELPHMVIIMLQRRIWYGVHSKQTIKPEYIYMQAIGLQNIILLGLLYKYQNRSFARKLFVVAIFGMWFAAAQGGYLTAHVLDALFDLNSLILLVSRIPQITQNYQSKSTGQLSFLTYLMNFMGTLARVFTTLQEKNAGPAMLRGVIMCTFLSSYIEYSTMYFILGVSVLCSNGHECCHGAPNHHVWRRQNIHKERQGIVILSVHKQNDIIFLCNSVNLQCIEDLTATRFLVCNGFSLSRANSISSL